MTEPPRGPVCVNPWTCFSVVQREGMLLYAGHLQHGWPAAVPPGQEHAGLSCRTDCPSAGGCTILQNKCTSGAVQTDIAMWLCNDFPDGSLYFYSKVTGIINKLVSHQPKLIPVPVPGAVC